VLIVPHSITFFTEELEEAEVKVESVPVLLVLLVAEKFVQPLWVPPAVGVSEVLRAAARLPNYPA